MGDLPNVRRIVADVRAARARLSALPESWRERIVSRWLTQRMPVENDSVWWAEGRRSAAWKNLETARARATNCDRRGINAASTRGEIDDFAERQATACRDAISHGDNEGVAEVRSVLRDWKIQHHIFDDATLWRTTNEKWWRRKLRRVHALTVERSAIALGFVGAGREKYLSDESLHLWQQGERATRQWLNATIMQGEDGKRFTLAELADKSPASMAVRRAELMQRIRGIEEYEKERGAVCLFVTITCPSRFHAMRNTERGAVVNDKYKGESPRDAQAHLVKTWAGIRKDVDRAGVQLHGVRIAEPHHDGCPHWHMLVWCASNHAAYLQGVVAAHALAVDGDEAGAAKHRVQFERIDTARGSAVAYIAKYLAKNVPKQQISVMTQKNKNNKSSDSAYIIADDITISNDMRPMIWARVWGIRQFQFFGSVPVTLWRMARRVENLPDDLRQACHRDGEQRADYGAFIRIVRERGLVLWREWVDTLNQFGEAFGWQAIGLTDSIGLSYGVTRRLWQVVSVYPPRHAQLVDSGRRF